MSINISQRIYKAVMPAIMALPLQVMAATTIEMPDNAPNHADVHLTVTTNTGSELQLEVQHTPLARVLNSLAQQINIPIHYSVLPKNLVTATCVGATLKEILECLLAEKAGLVFRYAKQTGNSKEIAEAWIMGSSLSDLPAQNGDCAAATVKSNSESAVKQASQNHESEPDRAEELLAMAKSKNPEDRAAAMSAILTDGIETTAAVKATLEDALTDQDASVRAQAVSTLAHLEDNNATPVLQAALRDSDVDVRLMAVDGITDDATLLNQAMNDSDETVRSLAAAKLEALTQQ